ncbi:hypothetical protein COLO4_27112 [Corchorus olitorius]|uniref:DUF4283 domain-containing protein n=1 Tax=Corchorus olitorius TaxID=93759 RepID=A0A1R3HSY0_9ROSI|nr:hypothetical protein COLO4_27112 [Corchorus olitorius]
MIQAWKPELGLSVKEVGEKLYLFEFDDKIERDRVLVTQPWSFQRSLLLLSDYNGYQQPDSVVFDACPFWIRVYGVPPVMMNDMVGYAIGSSIRLVQDVDDSDGRFLRIRVEQDIVEPIKKGTTITTPDGDLEVTFTYEKSPDYCYVCGSFIHQEGDCPIGIAQIKLQGFAVKKFSPNLKADSPTPKNRLVRESTQVFSAGIAPEEKPRSLVNGEGSSRVRSKAAASPFRRLRLEGGCDRREGKQALPAPSVVGDTDSVLQELGRRFQNHVDSLILHGRKVAREVGAEDGSCEIISEFHGKVDAVDQNFEAKRDCGQMVVASNKEDVVPRNLVMDTVGLRGTSGPETIILGVGPYMGQLEGNDGAVRNGQGLKCGGPILGRSKLRIGEVGQSDLGIGTVGKEVRLGHGVEGTVGPKVINKGGDLGPKKMVSSPLYYNLISPSNIDQQP